MRNYISIINLGDATNDFAIQLGIVAIQNDKYVSNALNESGELLHRQIFALPKSVEGIPANDVLQGDVLKAWNEHQARIRKAQGLESEGE